MKHKYETNVDTTDATNFRIVGSYTGTGEGGSCAICGKSITGLELHSVIGHFQQDKLSVPEPFSLCDECYNSAEIQYSMH